MARRTTRGAARRPSRAQERAKELADAARVAVPARCDVAVVGGGASGLVAAITAAEAGVRVVVLEAASSCGRSILATGNGRCNFANVSIDDTRYNDWNFVDAAFGEHPLDDVLDFFRAFGMRWQLEGDRLYPLSFQAASVRNVLLAHARKAGVALAPARAVQGVEPAADGQGWTVRYALSEDVNSPEAGKEHVLQASNVILATGPTALLVRELSSNLELGFVEPRPVLCPIICEDSPLFALDGRRVHGALSLVRGAFPIWRERGEVLLRSYGLSGMVSFNLSRRVHAGDVVLLDLVPDLSKSELRSIADPFASGTLKDGTLDGVLDPVIAELVIRLARKKWQPEGIDPEVWGAQDGQSESERAFALAKALPFRAKGLEGAQAQVHAGGLAKGCFDPKTLQETSHEGLFAAGEALDVDADCGGYNLMWAWKSGMVAGACAAGRARQQGK